MKVALTGATGIVGRFVAEYLGERGHAVQALVRPTSDRSGFVNPPRWIQGDLADEIALDELLNGVQALVHCAFSHAPGRYRGGEGDDVAAFWRINFGGTVNLLRAARRAGVGRVVLMSSRAVFAHRGPGEDPHSPLTDDYPPRPDTQYGALKMAEESLAAAELDIEVCALRPTGVYGTGYPPAQSKWFELVQQVLAGRKVSVSSTATEVHGRDVAQAVHLLLNAPADQVRGLAFNCSDITLSSRELVRLIARQAGVSVDLPEPSPAVVNPMACPRLQALGWQPGGQSLLVQTVDQLISAVRLGR